MSDQVLVAMGFNDATTKEEVIREIVFQLKNTEPLKNIRVFYSGDDSEGSLLILKDDRGSTVTLASAAQDYFEMDGSTFKEI